MSPAHLPLSLRYVRGGIFLNEGDMYAMSIGIPLFLVEKRVKSVAYNADKTSAFSFCENITKKY